MCAGERLARSIGGWRPTLRREQWPATAPGPRCDLATVASTPCPPRFQRLRPQGRGLGRAQHSAPTPALTATVSGLWARNLLCTRDLDGYPQNQREAQN